MDVVVVGAGAVGLALSSCLAEAGAQLRLVARPAAADALRSQGITRSGLFGHAHCPPARLRVSTRLADLTPVTADWLLVATKTFASAEVADALAASPAVDPAHTRLLVCQNGWGSAERFAARFPAGRVFSASLLTGFRRSGPARVEVTVHAEPIHVGSLFGAAAQDAAALCAAIERGGIPCRTSTTIAEDLLAKLLYNCLLNPLGALLGVPYGRLGEAPETRALLAALAHETFAVLDAAGLRTHWPDAEQYLADFHARLLPQTAAHESSMLQDLRAGRRTEIDALSGAVVALARRSGASAPLSAALATLIRALERRGKAREA